MRSFENRKIPGWVYALSNPAMRAEDGTPILKIGKSMAGGHKRARDGDKETFQAQPFNLEFEAFFKDYTAAENLVHSMLDAHRINPGREFFSCTLREAVAAISYAATDGEEGFQRLKSTAIYRDYAEDSHCYGGYWIQEELFLRLLQKALTECPNPKGALCSLLKTEYLCEKAHVETMYDIDGICQIDSMRIICLEKFHHLICDTRVHDREEAYQMLILRDQQLTWRRSNRCLEDDEESYLEGLHIDVHEKISELERVHPHLARLKHEREGIPWI